MLLLCWVVLELVLVSASFPSLSLSHHYRKSRGPRHRNSDIMSFNELPIEVIRKIFDELFHINEAYRWETPRLRYLKWMTVCKLWQALMTDLLYRSVQLENLAQLHQLSDAIKTQKRRARCIETFHLRDITRSKTDIATFTRIPFVNLRSLGLADVLVHKLSPRFNMSAATVTTVTLKDVTFASNETLRRFMKLFTKLTDLVVEGIHMDDATVVSILDVVGRKLERISITTHVRDLRSILDLIPQIKHLDIDIQSRSVWDLFPAFSLPQKCESFRIQTCDLVFTMEVILNLINPAFMPALKEFPKINWLPSRGHHPATYNVVPLKRLREDARQSLIKRGITWTEEEAYATMLEDSGDL